MKAATAGTRRSFVEDRAAEGSREVGDATAFVSHAWGYQFLDVVAALLEFGADARAVDAAGTSVLHYACYTCLSPAVVTLLLRAGALVWMGWAEQRHVVA